MLIEVFAKLLLCCVNCHDITNNLITAKASFANITFYQMCIRDRDETLAKASKLKTQVQKANGSYGEFLRVDLNNADDADTSKGEGYGALGAKTVSYTHLFIIVDFRIDCIRSIRIVIRVS